MSHGYMPKRKTLSVFEKNKRKANSSPIGKWMNDELGYRKSVQDAAEKSDKERTGQSGKHFEKRFDSVLGKKK